MYASIVLKKGRVVKDQATVFLFMMQDLFYPKYLWTSGPRSRTHPNAHIPDN